MQELLKEYNPHWEEANPYKDLIPRESYRTRLNDLIDRKEIIILKGIRRSGKSSLLKLVIGDLLKRGVNARNMMFMNLEDYRFGPEKTLETLDTIYQTYKVMHKPRGKRYILLDEIQEIPEFERWLRTYYEKEKQIKFVITGSSSSLFSSELGTLLTGRQISTEVFPFSFQEFLAHHAKTVAKNAGKKPIDSLYLSASFKKIEPLLQRYLDSGGFPEIIKNEQSDSNILLLQQYISDILLRDVAKRYNIRKVQVLQKLTLYLIFNMGLDMNVSRIAERIGSNRTTVLELIGYLREVYMVFPQSSFSFSGGEANTTKHRKIFCVDNGFYAAIKTDSKRDRYKKFKNTVFQQLRFQWGKQVAFWREKVEIDFVLEDGFPINIMPEDGSIDSEIDRLLYFMNNHNMREALLITWNKLQIIEENDRRILLLPLWLLLVKSEEQVRKYLSEGD